MLEKAATEFSRSELQPDREENDRFPFKPFFEQAVQKAFEADFFHLTVPEKFGGIGRGMQMLCGLLDRICRVDAGLGAILFTNAFAQEILMQGKSEKILQKIVENGKGFRSFLLAFPSFNNPNEINHRVHAEIAGEHFQLSGKLEYLVLGGLVKHAIIPASFAEEDDLSFFLVDLTRNSVQIGPPVFSLGVHACPAVDVSFTNTRAELIGEKNRGSLYFENALDRLQVAAAAISAGIMKGSLKEAQDYAKKRLQGGREIIKWSEIQMILSNMTVMTQTADLAVRQAAVGVDEKTDNWRLSSRAVAVQVQESACRVATDGIQVLGGYGYMKDYGQEKRYRDAKQLQALLGLLPLKKMNCLFKSIGKTL